MRFVPCLIVAMLLAFTVSAHALDAGKPVPTVALVVDVQRVLDESEAARGVQKQLASQRAQFQSDTEKEENQLRTAEQELNKAHEKLSADAYGEREQQLRQRFISVERHVEARRKALDQSFTDAMNIVRDNLLNIVQGLAKDKGANLVLVKQQILWSDKSLDVTDELLKKLNKALPKVQVKAPQDTDGDK